MACFELGREDGDRFGWVGLDGAFVVHLEMPWPDVRAELPTLMRTRPLLQDRTEDEIHELFLRRQATYGQADLSVSAPRGGVMFSN